MPRSSWRQVDAMENMFREGNTRKQRFSLSAPRASYISEAFAAFTRTFSDVGEIEAFYRETNAMRTLKNVLEDGYNLGIIRYAAQYDRYYKDMLEEKGLAYELIWRVPAGADLQPGLGARREGCHHRRGSGAADRGGAR